MYVDEVELVGMKQNIDPMWEVFMKEVDLGEPTSFLDHVYLGCTQRECQTSNDVVDNKRNMFESKLSARATEMLLYSEKFGANISSWFYERVMPRNVWNDIASWRTKQLNNNTKSQLHALTTTNSRIKKWDLLENCQMLLTSGFF